MILEAAQMLCTVLSFHEIDTPYRPTHKKHPCTIWAGESLSNWLWLKDLAGCLNSEYNWRYDNGDHKSYLVIKELPTPPIDDLGLTPFAMAMPEEYKQDDIVKAYRQYYRAEKADIATWKEPAKKPRWF
tara:strand:+ start:3815 stop:4201 length:387 start_codon:yes stop_codon:yes gene_type:complete